MLKFLQAPDENELVGYHFVAFVFKDGDLYELGKSYDVDDEIYVVCGKNSQV